MCFSLFMEFLCSTLIGLGSPSGNQHVPKNSTHPSLNFVGDIVCMHKILQPKPKMSRSPLTSCMRAIMPSTHEILDM